MQVKTGEEDETILFESRGKMYRFVSGEWKEKGVGVVKILEHKINKKTRVLMRRDQVSQQKPWIHIFSNLVF